MVWSKLTILKPTPQNKFNNQQPTPNSQQTNTITDPINHASETPMSARTISSLWMVIRTWIGSQTRVSISSNTLCFYECGVYPATRIGRRLIAHRGTTVWGSVVRWTKRRYLRRTPASVRHLFWVHQFFNQHEDCSDRLGPRRCIVCFLVPSEYVSFHSTVISLILYHDNDSVVQWLFQLEEVAVSTLLFDCTNFNLIGGCGCGKLLIELAK